MTLRSAARLLCAAAALASGASAGAQYVAGEPPRPAPDFVREHDVAVAMRDGVVLRAEVWRPHGPGPFPVLVYRTPYGKDSAVAQYTLFRKAVERGYAVVAQDVRGRYASDGEFLPYQQEGRDGYDTIEWAARQPWSSGSVGTFGLSYPGAVQWLAAVEGPPHLKAMVPAMTFASPRQFFYSGGVWDASWASWIWHNIAPDLRKRRNVSGPRTYADAAGAWGAERDRVRAHLPLLDLPDFRDVAPWYYEWIRHSPEDPWWDWAELRGKYDRTDAAVLNLSGWHDEAYGPHGATTNFAGLVAARGGKADRVALIVGPWAHGLGGMRRDSVGDRAVGAAARLDYDETVLGWMDRWLRGRDTGADVAAPVRVFVLGANSWREAPTWPLPGTRYDTLYLARGAADGTGRLTRTAPARAADSSVVVSDPMRPVTDPYAERAGAHDYRALAARPDVLTFETEPLAEDVEVVGAMTAEVHLAADAPDTDLWVRVLDVAPDGTAYNLMSPGLDVVRASYRGGSGGPPAPLEAGRVYRLVLPDLLTANRFRRGHRVRVHLMTAFAPHFSRNLHTGASERDTRAARAARVVVRHDARYPSRVILPVVPVVPVR
ncbi:MAG TPA: CocE/NonD family hydrolase [Gemmatimonadaceae bacterium]|nr:CocE/NonD family hydrolase [Gemmatimonadaceae bacterium]